MAMTRTRPTSASGRSSRGEKRFGRAAALLLGAAALFLILSAAPCPALTLSGLPEWLEPSVLRSLEAVWDEIPDAPGVDRIGTLSVVTARLFAGYRVVVSPGPAVSFERGETPHWSVRISLPELREPVLEWFGSQ